MYIYICIYISTDILNSHFPIHIYVYMYMNINTYTHSLNTHVWWISFSQHTWISFSEHTFSEHTWMMNLFAAIAAIHATIRWTHMNDGVSICGNRIAAIAANRHTIIELLCAWNDSCFLFLSMYQQFPRNSQKGAAYYISLTTTLTAMTFEKYYLPHSDSSKQML